MSWRHESTPGEPPAHRGRRPMSAGESPRLHSPSRARDVRDAVCSDQKGAIYRARRGPGDVPAVRGNARGTKRGRRHEPRSNRDEKRREVTGREASGRAALRSKARSVSLRTAAALVLRRPIGAIVIRTRRARATIRSMLARRTAMRVLRGGVAATGVLAISAAFPAATTVAERSVLRSVKQQSEQDSGERREQDHLDGRSRLRNRTCRHALHRTCRRLGAEVPATSNSKWGITPAASARFPASPVCADASDRGRGAFIVSVLGEREG